MYIYIYLKNEGLIFPQKMSHPGYANYFIFVFYISIYLFYYKIQLIFMQIYMHMCILFRL